MKLKIRKVEVNSIEFFDALDAILLTHERIPRNKYLGSSLDYICRNLGIKDLEFWKLKFEFENEFNKRFIIKIAGFDTNLFFLWRKETYDHHIKQ